MSAIRVGGREGQLQRALGRADLVLVEAVPPLDVRHRDLLRVIGRRSGVCTHTVILALRSGQGKRVRAPLVRRRGGVTAPGGRSRLTCHEPAGSLFGGGPAALG